MQHAYLDLNSSRAEFGFELFPYGPFALEAERVLCSLEGVFQALFDPCVSRASVLFDPTRTNIPSILTALELFGLKPRVISVVTPLREVVYDDNRNFA